MPIDPNLEDILLRWDEERARGRVLPLEEICRDQPHLLDQARRLIGTIEKVDDLIGEGGEVSGRTKASADGAGDAGCLAGLPDDIATGALYHAVRLHARGGLGEIFVAWEKELGREVALKLIQCPHDRDPDLRSRFLREAEITAGLGHPGVVPIFGIGRASDGRPCYAMRYIEGETLRTAIGRFHEADTPERDPHERALAFRALLSRLVAVCQAVAFAHSRGIIHRDLKPDNVMLGPFQETLVVDWGLARRLRHDDSPAAGVAEPSESRALSNPGDQEAVEDTSLTRMGSTLGTPGYMSPEQASGRWGEVGPSSDVYSLGATLYFILAGRPPFPGPSRAALLDRVRRGDFLPPRRVKASVPRALEAVCLKAMALRPEDRHASIVKLAADLECWLADEPVSAWHEPVIERLLRWTRRHRPLVAGIAALAATALVALTVSAVLLSREQANTRLALEDAQANYRLARTTMADVQTSFGLSAADRHVPAEAALWFAEAAETADIDPERAFANRTRARGWGLLSPMPVAAVNLNAPVPDPGAARSGFIRSAFDRRGRFLAALSTKGQCAVLSVPAGQPIPLPRQPRYTTAIAWGGPEGDLLGVGDAHGDVELIRVPSGEVVDRVSVGKRVWNLEFSGDGRLLAMGGGSPRVRDVVSKTDVTLPLALPEQVVQFAFSPRSDRLAVKTAEGRVSVFDLTAPRASPLFETAANPWVWLRSGKVPFRVVFVDDGKGILIRHGERELAWLDAATGAEVRRLQSNLSAVHNVLVSPDGRVIVATGLVGVQLWDARTGQPLGAFGDVGIEAAAFTPDGESLLLSDGHYKLTSHRFPGGQPGDWSIQLQDLAIQLIAAPDGAHFALNQADGLVRVWRVPARSPGDRIIKTAATSSLLVMDPAGRLGILLGKYLSQGPTKTQVHDLERGKAGRDLAVAGIIHGGAIALGGHQAVTLSSPAGVLPKGTTELLYPVGSAKGEVQFWDWEAGTRLGDPIETPSEPVGAAYDPSGRRLVVLCSLGELLWIDPADQRVTHVRKPAGRRYTPGTPANELLRFSPDGTLLVEWGTGTPVLLDATTGEPHSPALSSPSDGPEPHALDARFSPDGRHLATAGGDKAARVWELANGREVALLRHPDWVFQAVFSAGGSLIVTGCRDARARVFDWRTGQTVGIPLTHEGEVQDVRFLDGDRWVLTKSADGAVRLWDWRGGRPITPPHRVAGAWGSPLCVAPDGRLAAIGSYQEQAIHVFDLAAWLNNHSAVPPGHLREIAELGSGQRIARGSAVVNLTSSEWLERWSSYRAAVDAPSPWVPATISDQKSP